MTGTQRKDALRNIRANKVSFLSIVVIAMLAVMAFLGISYASEAISRTASDYYEKQQMWDIAVTSTLLMDGEDLAAIRALPGVETAEASMQMTARLLNGEEKEDVMLATFTQELALPELLAGRLPEAETECALEEWLAEKTGLSIGARIRIENDTLVGTDPVRQKEYTVTGIFRHPDHITFSVSVTPYILVMWESFDLGELDGSFPAVFLRVSGAPAGRYGEDYSAAVAAVQDEVEGIAAARAEGRSAKLRGIYEEQIADGQRQLDEAEEQLRAAQEKLDEGRRDLDAAEEKLKAGKQKLDDGLGQLKEAEEEIREGREKLRAGKEQLDEIADLIREIAGDILASITEEDWPPDIGITYAQFREAVSQGKEYLLEWIYEVSGYNAGLEKLFYAGALRERGRIDWYYSGEEYLDGVTRYEQGKKKLEEGERELAEGRAAWEDGNRRLQEARDKLAQIGECRWIVLNNESNSGYLFSKTNAENYASLSMTFSLLFVIVGALVIYATVGRMVEEQSRLVGATKAMGLYNREIFAKYLLFGVSGTLLGAALGIVLGYWGIQTTMLFAMSSFFIYGMPVRVFLPGLTALVVACGLLLAVFSVWFACSRLLKTPAIKLMQGDTLSSRLRKAKRRGRGSLYLRLIWLNMRTDLKRVSVTIVSVMGCCVLLMVGFTVKYAISGVFERQFDQIITHDLRLSYEKAGDDQHGAALEEALQRRGLRYVRAFCESRTFLAGQRLSLCPLVVVPSDALGDFYRVVDAQTREPLPLPESGVLVPQRMQELYGTDPGAVFQLNDSQKIPFDARVGGVYENYFLLTVFCSPEAYEEIYGEAAGDNCFLIRTDGAETGALAEELAALPGFVRLEDARADRSRLEVLTTVLSLVIVILTIMAILLAYFILLNLSETFIQQRRRELTIMRINGFSTGECIRYVACDLAITTVLGTVLGLFAGAWLGDRIARLMEQTNVMFVREADPRSFVLSFLITVLISVGINSLALRKIRSLKLSDLS